MTIEQRLSNLEKLVNALSKKIDDNKFYQQADIDGTRQSVNTLCNTVVKYNLAVYDEATETVPLHIQKRRVLKFVLPMMQGSDVVYCQRILQNLGYDLGKTGADSKYGKRTEEAIKAFQRERSLVDDGKVGPKTWAMLEKYN